MLKANMSFEVLKELTRLISALVDDVKIEIKQNGIELKALDPAHVAMLQLNLSKKCFTEYKAKDCEIGIDNHKLRQLLKLGKNGDIFSLEHNEDKNKLVVTVGNITRKISTIDTTTLSQPKVPDLNPPVKVVIDTHELVKGIKASEMVSDSVSIIISPEGFEMFAKGDIDEVSLNVPKASLKDLISTEKTKSNFDLDYMSKIIKSIPTENASLYNGTDYPLSIEFDIADGHGQCKFLLAPRIEGE